MALTVAAPASTCGFIAALSLPVRAGSNLSYLSGILHTRVSWADTRLLVSSNPILIEVGVSWVSAGYPLSSLWAEEVSRPEPSVVLLLPVSNLLLSSCSLPVLKSDYLTVLYFIFQALARRYPGLRIWSSGLNPVFIGNGPHTVIAAEHVALIGDFSMIITPVLRVDSDWWYPLRMVAITCLLLFLHFAL